MVSVLAWLRNLEARAAGLTVAEGPLATIITKGGQGRTPGQVARVALEHVLWRIGRDDAAAFAAMSDQEVFAFLWKLREKVYHFQRKDET